MFEKFTERARKVMSLARQEAQRLNSETIGTEHILLGIIQEGGGVAAKVLKNLNVDLKRLRQEIEKLVTPSTSPTVTLGQLNFSVRAKHVIELAEESATQLGADVIATEHLLLGLLKENEGIGAQALINSRIDLDGVRDMILEVLGVDPEVSEEPQAEPVKLPDAEAMKKTMTHVSKLTEEVESHIVKRAEDYGVRGNEKVYRHLTFQITRVNGAWGVYLKRGEHYERITGCPFEEKLDFLDVANVLEREHISKIARVFEKTNNILKKYSL